MLSEGWFSLLDHLSLDPDVFIFNLIRSYTILIFWSMDGFAIRNLCLHEDTTITLETGDEIIFLTHPISLTMHSLHWALYSLSVFNFANTSSINTWFAILPVAPVLHRVRCCDATPMYVLPQPYHYRPLTFNNDIDTSNFMTNDKSCLPYVLVDTYLDPLKNRF